MAVEVTSDGSDTTDQRATTTSSLTVPVSGMTCASCQQRVTRALLRVPGVETVAVSVAGGRAVVTGRTLPDRDRIEAAIRRAGYRPGKPDWINRDRSVWVVVGGATLAVAVLAWLAGTLGLADLPARLADPGRGGLLVVLILGLTAGVSTCMAMVGGLVLSVSAAHAATVSAASTTSAIGTGSARLVRMRPHVAFNVGRVLGFGLLGAGLGAVGATMSLPARGMGLLIVMVAVVMALLGLRLTGVSPRLAGWTPTLPAGLGRVLGLDAAGSAPYSDGRAVLMGAATFVLPCGFTQAVQVFAVSTASPLTAGVVMATFALGTSPGLLALAGVPELATGPRRNTVLRIVGVVVLGFAVLNASGGLRLMGLSIGSAAVTTTAGQQLSGNVTVANGIQTVRMSQLPSGYQPADTVVYAGMPIKWVITGTSPFDCSSALRVPTLGVSANLIQGINTVQVPALAAGVTDFTCVMGMYSGRLVAVAPPAATVPPAEQPQPRIG